MKPEESTFNIVNEIKEKANRFILSLHTPEAVEEILIHLVRESDTQRKVHITNTIKAEYWAKKHSYYSSALTLIQKAMELQPEEKQWGQIPKQDIVKPETI